MDHGVSRVQGAATGGNGPADACRWPCIRSRDRRSRSPEATSAATDRKPPWGTALALACLLAVGGSLWGGNVSPVAIGLVPPAQLPFSDWDVRGLRLNLLLGRHQNVGYVDLATLGNLCKGDLTGLEFAGVANRVQGRSVALQAAGGYNLNDGDFSGIQLSVLLNRTGGVFRGVQLGGVLNQAQSRFYGIQLGAGLCNTEGDFYGIQFGGKESNAAQRFHGLQFSCIYNECGGNSEAYGVQLAPQNLAYNLTGVQVGAVNRADHDMLGLQFGVFNEANIVSGLQVGLWNVAGSLDGVQLGIVNLVRQGPFPFMPIANIGF